MKANEIVKTDVLIIGSGGAGLRAAIEANKCDVDVTIVTKGLLGRDGATQMAEMAAAVIPGVSNGDNIEAHFKDTIESGAYINDPSLVKVFVEEAGLRLIELEDFGIYWERNGTGKKYLLSPMPGHTFNRSIFFKDRTGHEIIRVLKNEIHRHNIRVKEETFITSLLTNKDSRKIVGATAVDIKSGEFIVLWAKAIVLATGGAGQVYLMTTNPIQSTGDGLASAYRIGADIIDMEFFQFYPAILVYPNGLKGSIIGIYHLGKLFNLKGERFMEKYDPKRLEQSLRDIVSRAIYSEIKQGRGTKNGGIYLDLTQVPIDVINQYNPDFLIKCRRAGVNVAKDILEIAPAAHYMMGGIRINSKCETNVRGLYAAGEVTGGLHGANRLGNNSLSEILVFGARAGRYAAEYASTTKHLKIDTNQVDRERKWIYSFFKPKREGKKSPLKIKKTLQKLMWENVGLVRNKSSLEKAILEIEQMRMELQSRICLTSMDFEYNYEWVETIELRNLLDVARIITKSALFRTESRGAHFREDYPWRDDANWLKNLLISGELIKACPVRSQTLSEKKCLNQT